ncbi:relaxase/mobilization nuclease domain-containing protein (plasmid) [Sinorhizobium medicae]|uniref:relaxase/mobilization nuclease domain-containing protein n=1 Tax=Sinorhizobium medicae TaxID=110321 RepID=UPI002AF6B2D1|nr:relaxase/mobilization nuclease domain-containing protein [Sinorhizobium medicae]WQO48380.1 relaxase/mobilization nuclease domain-containing protein [Sinorhizobium medicae]WQO68794.1 relaxase/mobilization nuclease domain-containing protein [Sinorhizobium medicae]WQO75833.1 relaxase/mobilization nuclease domain-containing protein [Sinorhizobium medicae]
MAYEWASLLGEVDTYSARRVASLVDDDEKRRRGRASGPAVTSDRAEKRYLPTGIAARAATIFVPSGEQTIASILQPARSSQQDVVALVGALASRTGPEEDDELRRGGGGGGSAARQANPPIATRRSLKDKASLEVASRAALAAGAQPVVIKVTSTVSSRASAAGLLTYLGTREAENEDGRTERVDIPVIDQDGIAIVSREARAAVLSDWTAEFRDPYAVNAVATISIKFAERVGDGDLHEVLNAAFGSKPFLYSHRPDGEVSVYAVTDLPAGKLAIALKAREKGDGSVHTAETAEGDLAARLANAGRRAEVCILGAATSEKSSRYFLEKFLRAEQRVITSAGDAVKRGSPSHKTADCIWQEWSGHIRTVEPRNAFHVIFSARAGTDAQTMNRAVRDFLSEQVAGHRWITAHHPDTGHVHVHAMIAARDHVGKALRLTKPELYQWRERFAEKAREHGIAMVATRRADVAATRPYSQAQAGAYQRGLTDPRYLMTPALNNRVRHKRAGVADRASLANGSLALAQQWRATVDGLKKVGAKSTVIDAANRFAAATADKTPKPAARTVNGFVLVRIEINPAGNAPALLKTVERALQAHPRFASEKAGTALLLAPTGASISKIERELTRRNEMGPGAETLEVVNNIERRLFEQGLSATVSVEAAGGAQNGAPTPWLQSRFAALDQRTASKPAAPLAKLMTLVSDIKQRKENTMPLSLEQFDERVARANKSMDRLETMVDSSGERQAVEEMRREISALFAEQRRDIELQQIPSAMHASGGGGTPSTIQAGEGHDQNRKPPASVDPAIAVQQQAIATGRAAKAAREQAGGTKTVQDERRREIARQTEHERENNRDGAER